MRKLKLLHHNVNVDSHQTLEKYWNLRVPERDVTRGHTPSRRGALVSVLLARDRFTGPVDGRVLPGEAPDSPDRRNGKAPVRLRFSALGKSERSCTQRRARGTSLVVQDRTTAARSPPRSLSERRLRNFPTAAALACLRVKRGHDVFPVNWHARLHFAGTSLGK